MFTIGNKQVGDKNCFIIAEIGQNHQGDLSIAKAMILAAKSCGADCVKFQKSCLSEKFTQGALNRPYNNNNSWGKTYGEHKQHLEFSMEEYRILQSFAKKHNILFTASAMDIESLKELYKLNVPFIKIGSGDTNNFPLIEYAAARETPLIISTGMQTEYTIRKVVDILQAHKKQNFCLMHCVSEYPTPPENANLRMIELYRKWFPNICIGYSGHELEISAISCTAYLLGARVIERHFTLDKTQKGTDHKISLEPDEFDQFSENLHIISKKSFPIMSFLYEILEILKNYLNFKFSELENVTMALKNVPNEKNILNCEKNCWNKLGKTLVYANTLNINDKLKPNDISIKVSEPKGITTDFYYNIFNRVLKTNVQLDEPIDLEHFYEDLKIDIIEMVNVDDDLPKADDAVDDDVFVVDPLKKE